MSNTRLVPTGDVLQCPECHREVSFVASWTRRALWGYEEIRTYECPDHGPFFVSPQSVIDHRPNIASATASDDGDRDSLVTAPRKPTPTSDADAIAIPEPEPEAH